MKKIFKKLDNLVFNHAYQAYSRGGGINSNIIYYHFPDKTKEVVARYGVLKNGFSLEQAKDLHADMAIYQAELEDHKVPMPTVKKNLLEYDYTNNRAVIVKTSSWTGHELANIIRELEQPEQVLELVEKMFDIIFLVCQNRLEGWNTKTGIDPRVTNFTLDENNQMWFVDIFPPRYRKNNQALVEWPKPQTELGNRLGYFKHFDVRGIILCSLAQLARIKPHMKTLIEERVLQKSRSIMTESEYKEFTGELLSAPWVNLRGILQKKETEGSLDIGQIKEIISSALEKKMFGVPYNIYTLREIATEMAAMNIISESELERFFRLSHFEDELPADKVDLLRQMLIDFVYNNN